MNSESMSNEFSAQSAHGGTPHTNDTVLITKMLEEFGLEHKETQLYVHLLKYGPKRAGDLARSLKTYRLDIYRKLTSLVEKNMVSVKKESPAVYSAVDLYKALNDVVLARQRELHQMENIKLELLECVDGRQLRPQDEALLPETHAIDGDRVLKQLLTAFGLREKDAQLYAHLLKYGPQRAGDLARSLKTYREDVYRRCTRLIDFEMATKTSDDSSRYIPIELDIALNNVILAQKRELRRLQRIEQKVVKNASLSLWRKENVHSSFKLVKTVGEVITIISHLINSAETSIIFVAHQRFNLISMGGFQNHLRCAVARDVRVRGVLDIDQRNASVARESLNCGVELRHSGHYCGMTMVVADGKRSISLINADLKTALSLDENVAALRSNSIEQAEFLTSAFEMTWKQAINAEEHMNQQLHQCPHHETRLEPADKARSIVGYTAAHQPSLTRS